MERLTKDNGKAFEPFRYSLEDISTYKIYDLFYEITFKVLQKLGKYEDAEEQGLLLRLPCKVGDAVYLIDKDENNRLQVYEGKWRRVSLVQTSKNSSFELCGEISYDIHDCFYNDGRTMEQGMYVGQESTRIGKVVFLTREEAEVKLKEMEEKDGE